MESHISGDAGFAQVEIPAQVAEPPHNRGDPEPATRHNLTIVKCDASHPDTTPFPAFALARKDRLDWICRSDVEAVQPGRGLPRKSCRGRKAQSRGLQLQRRSLRQAGPRIQAGSEPAPARPFEVPALKAGPPGLGHRERSASELIWHKRPPRHELS